MNHDPTDRAGSSNLRGVVFDDQVRLHLHRIRHVGQFRGAHETHREAAVGQFQAQVVARDTTDPILWLADEQFNTISLSDNARPTDLNPLLNGRILPKTGKYYLIFREMNSAPSAKFQRQPRS